MATDLESLVLSISADTTALKRALDRTQKDVKQTADNIDRSFQSIDPMGRAAANFNRSSRAMANDAKVLGFQFNDLATQIASGTSAAQAFSQQAGQIGQILGGAGGIRGAASLIGSALAGMVPTAVIVAAFSAISYAASSYFDSADEAAKETNKALDEHRRLIKDAADKWGASIPYLKAYSAELEAIAERQAKLDIADTLRKDAFKPTVEAVASVEEQVKRLHKAMSVGSDEARADARKLAEAWKAFEAEISAGRPGQEQLKTLVALIAQFEKSGVEGANAVADAIGKNLAGALDTTSQKLKQINRDFGELDDRAESLASLREANRDAIIRERDAYNADRTAIMALTDASAKLIAQEESFRSKAYPDKRSSTGEFDAWRVGFGSDTFVDQMGNVQRVTKETVVTFEQATRDLARRIPEFQATIQGQIGGELWKSLEDGQQAALTSIAYNYGRLPASIVKAIQEGDRGQVAQAIAGLSANPERRQREAQMYGGQSYTAKAAKEATPYIDEEARALDGAAEAAARLLQQQRALTPEQQRLADSAKQVSQQYAQIAQTAISGFVNDLRNGVEAGEAFHNMLNRVIDGIINMAIEAMFAKNALGGVFGGIFGGATASAATMHGGGKVGGASRSMRQGVNPAIFAGAPRFHNGLLPGEFPAILQKGEIVLPKNMAKTAGGNVGNTYFGDVTVNANGTVAATSEQGKALGVFLEKAMAAFVVKERKPGGLLRA